MIRPNPIASANFKSKIMIPEGKIAQLRRSSEKIIQPEVRHPRFARVLSGRSPGLASLRTRRIKPQGIPLGFAQYSLDLLQSRSPRQSHVMVNYMRSLRSTVGQRTE